MARSELLTPEIAEASWSDGRGAILTFYPNEDIKEFNLVYFKAGATRGNHKHVDESMVEYFGVCNEGRGIFCYVDSETGEKFTEFLTPGKFMRTPPGVSHAFYALCDTTCLALLAKRWNDCNPPIVHEHVTTKDEITKTPLVS